MMSRLSLLITTAILLLTALLIPTIKLTTDSYNFVFIVDITQSMNTQDYSDDYGKATSRLDKVKHEILQTIQTLPCGSKVGLGLFTERSYALLFSPVEVCENFEILKTSISRIDWRMAWVADSNIGVGLYNILQSFDKPFLNKSKLVFFTDGHEAPPINPRYQPDFSDLVADDVPEAWRAGTIIGVGNKGLTNIPKYDEEGTQTGFYQVDDVPHATSFGLPEDPSKIEGYVPRNGPWGTQKIVGTEHMSSLKEDYLRKLSEQARLNYHHLQTTEQLSNTLQIEKFVQAYESDADISAIPALLALLILSYLYLGKYQFTRSKTENRNTVP